MKKFIVAGVIIIILMIPIVSISAIAEQPFKFIGDMIFANGDTDTLDKDVEELYQMLLKTELGDEVTKYILKEKDIAVSDILLPIALVYQGKNLDMEKITIESLQAKDEIDLLIKLKKENPSTEKYVQAIKKEEAFQSLNQYSDTTLILYLNDLNNTEDSQESNNKIDVDSQLYQYNNPFVPTYRGQCTWFAWCRTKEITGKAMPTGNARDWLDQTDLPTGTVPKKHSVGVFGGTGIFPNNQHVVFVEDYKDGMITISEGNYDNPCTNGTCDMVEYANKHYKELVKVTTMPYDAFILQRQYSFTLKGWIYAD